MRGLRRGGAAVAVAALLAPALAACGGGSGGTATAPATTPRDAPAEVMAAAVHRLVSRDHTFGTGPHRFAEYLLVDHVDATGPGEPRAPSGRPLTTAERAAIAGVVAPFGPYRFIADAGAWRTGDLRPVVAGSAIIGVGEPAIDGDSARAPVALWCGGLCGTWRTYRLTRAAGAWRVTGTVGPVAVS